MHTLTIFHFYLRFVACASVGSFLMDILFNDLLTSRLLFNSQPADFLFFLHPHTSITSTRYPLSLLTSLAVLYWVSSSSPSTSNTHSTHSAFSYPNYIHFMRAREGGKKGCLINTHAVCACWLPISWLAWVCVWLVGLGGGRFVSTLAVLFAQL